MKISFLMMLLLVVSVGNAATTDTLGNPRFDDFYTVKEQVVKSHDTTNSINPVDMAHSMWSDVESFYEISAKIYSLVEFDYHKEKYGDVTEPYNRQKHFGGWLNDHRDDNCYNTRAKVLIRDSSVPVSFRSNGCTVSSGKWADPYGARDYTSAADIQIDHFVPLKNAYISGAYKWNREKRCLYGNFLGNDFHLLAVYGKENSSKSDKTPEGYMPPNRAYQCQYLAQWLKIKLIWSLGLTPPEKDTVVELVRDNHCDLNQFAFSAQELAQQRRFIADNMNLCQ
ncbi:HNH endonuclease family protein [Bdellovibrio bacteriovorus]|uniref:HNH endonuclease family protein n=1 Tax=Bdellovibrio bacteriovorus TaxID=959 RepID=UPI0035A969AD